MMTVVAEIGSLAVMRTSSLITLICVAVVFLALGVAALCPFTPRTPVPMPDGSTVSVLDGTCLIADDRIAFGLIGASGVLCIATVLYRFIPRRSSTMSTSAASCGRPC